MPFLQRGFRSQHVRCQWNYFLCTLILVVVCSAKVAMRKVELIPVK